MKKALNACASIIITAMSSAFPLCIFASEANTMYIGSIPDIYEITASGTIVSSSYTLLIVIIAGAAVLLTAGIIIAAMLLKKKAPAPQPPVYQPAPPPAYLVSPAPPRSQTYHLGDSQPQHPQAAAEDNTEADDTEVMEAVFGAACLEYYDNGLLRRINLNKPKVIVGRSQGQVDYVIKNMKVGKVHAEFITQGGNYFVRDCNSTNGTYVSGERVPSNVPHEIHDGDTVKMADQEMTFKCNTRDGHRHYARR